MQSQSKPFLLDVRTPEEWQKGHIEESHHIPLTELLNGELPVVPKETPIYAYCRSGNRSEIARRYLKKCGFTDVHNIQTLARAKEL